VPHRRSSGPQLIAQAGELIVESDPLRASGRLLRQGGMEASYTDLADPRHLEFDYLRWIRVALTSAHARRVLHVGGAGCTLARALAAADPEGRQEVWEIDPSVVEIARGFLGLRRAPGLRVRVGDGTSALAVEADDSRDAVVIDAFIGARVAPGPSSAAALADAARVAPLTLINVVDNRAGHELARIAAGLAEVYPRVWAISGRSRNTVLGADHEVLDLGRLRGPLARDPSPAVLELLGS
jgi:SAM-dependent methyltransferase